MKEQPGRKQRKLEKKSKGTKKKTKFHCTRTSKGNQTEEYQISARN